jgi:tRNA-intron endonuclease
METVDLPVTKIKQATTPPLKKLRFKAFLTKQGRVFLSKTHENESSIEELRNRGYGKLMNQKLFLKPYEALFLLTKNVIELVNEKSAKEVNFQKLLHVCERLDPNIWMKFLIYRDLRSRGYVVREGFGLGIDFRVYEKGMYKKGTAKYLILGIQEGKPISIEELTQILRNVQSLKKKLILAVLSRRGEVVYYSLSRLTLTKI